MKHEDGAARGADEGWETGLKILRAGPAPAATTDLYVGPSDVSRVFRFRFYPEDAFGSGSLPAGLTRIPDGPPGFIFCVEDVTAVTAPDERLPGSAGVAVAPAPAAGTIR